MNRRAHIVGVGETQYARWGKITDTPEHTLAIRAIQSRAPSLRKNGKKQVAIRSIQSRAPIRAKQAREVILGLLRIVQRNDLESKTQQDTIDDLQEQLAESRVQSNRVALVFLGERLIDG